MTKVWWRSKTMWVNIFTLFILIATHLQGIITDPDILNALAMVIVVSNILLRAVTHTAITWEEDANDSME